MTLDHSPAGLATLFAEIGRQLQAYGRTADAMDAVAHTAVQRVPGSEWASISQGHKGTFITVASTDPGAVAVDKIQYELRSGPCVDAILQETVFRIDDLRTDARWPEMGERAVSAGVRSMLSLRLFLENDDLVAGLNMYATRTNAFDDNAQTIGILLATHGALAISAAAARERAAQLRQALVTSREIGVAMGVLMSLHKTTRDQAFDLLRIASQNTNRKLADIATEVGDTGTIDLPGRWAGIVPPSPSAAPLGPLPDE